MNSALSPRWDRFWYARCDSRQYVIARWAISVSALWVLLSRPTLGWTMSLPEQLLSEVTLAQRIRFILLDGPGEQFLYYLAIGALFSTLIGFHARLAALLSGILLYNLGPLETIVWSPNPYLRGLTIPALSLLILSFGPGGGARFREETSDYSAWQLRLIQSLICLMYFLAGYSKLFMTGWSWAEGDNLARLSLALDQGLGYDWSSTAASVLRGHPGVFSVMGVAGLVFELSVPVVLFSRVARRIFVPVAILFHAANWVLFHIAFPGFLWLVVFIDLPAASRMEREDV